MISFDAFRIKDGIPIYVQIVEHVKLSIVSGKLKDGEEMPSRRVLSALLGINPNTVQRAYRLLEEESIIKSSAGAISRVSLDEEKIKEIRDDLLKTYVQSAVNVMKNMGVGKEEAIWLFDKLWR